MGGVWGLGRSLGVGLLVCVLAHDLCDVLVVVGCVSEDDSDFPQSEVLRRITHTLDEALQARDVQKLQFTLLSGLLKVRRQAARDVGRTQGGRGQRRSRGGRLLTLRLWHGCCAWWWCRGITWASMSAPCT